MVNQNCDLFAIKKAKNKKESAMETYLKEINLKSA
tara:strand:- start:8712 stop:8816 length:105 start_codon:yes stop_codon:yes gene_type:complete